ncbi:LysR family transcriptional regulator [Paraferrimonas sedimenticola]|uniref:LysR family transcriptional regulator n=1 Tax=Paraferrimonas sedimenticola TaxID=375674 RepID=A0AA37RVM0_9GAMM|nr:LysR family transcriptional regulator [Paraferrimonas sedimenticola]GLP96240.1 LysR family transcriptional regulator [Paraferrimonas sedimenticola]
MNFSLDQLLAFVTSVEKGSYKQAAIALGKHATTVSQQVAALEIDSNLLLFERKVRKLELTQQGAELYQYAKPVLVEAGQLAMKVEALSAQEPGELKLAFGSTIRDRQLVRCAKEVLKRYPTIDLSIRSGDPLQILEWVADDQVHLGIITTLFGNYPGIDSVQMYNFELAYIGPPDWVKPDQKVDPAMLRALPQIVYRYVLQSPQMQGHMQSNHSIEVQSLEDLVDMVSLGLGWAIVPAYRVVDALEQQDVVAFQIQGANTVNWFCEAVFKSGQQLNPAAQAFMEQVQKLPDR